VGHDPSRRGRADRRAVALNAEVIRDTLFSVIVVVMVLVSVLPAPLFKRSLAKLDRDRRQAESAGADPP